MLNNGSHFVDLLRFLLGDVTQIHLIESGRKWEGQDPEPDVCLRFGQTPVYFLAAREECFSIGAIELIGTRGKIRYDKEGGAMTEITKSQPDPNFSRHTVLSMGKQAIPTDLERYQWHVLDHLHRHLIYNAPLNSNGKSATETLEVIENIFKSM